MNGGMKWIRVRGARMHNLHNVDVDLPRNQLIVLTGPSGSGKSSLAFDTLYAEGQRRYLETLRVDHRSLFDQLQRPDVDLIEGMPPPLCVSQTTTAPRLRSTLATITEIDDYLRLLWARAGTPYCYRCGKRIQRQTTKEIQETILGMRDGSKVLILAPLVERSKGENEAALQQIRQAGFLRARIDGVVTEIQDDLSLKAKQKHTIEMVVDRLFIRAGVEDRLRDSLRSALKHGHDRVMVADVTSERVADHAFSTRYSCTNCDITYQELSPRSFSFNSPYGACPECNGLGYLSPAEEDRTKREEQEAEPESTQSEVCPACRGSRLNQEVRSVRFAGRTLPQIAALTVMDARQFFTSVKQDSNSATSEQVQSVLLPEIINRLHFLNEVGLGYVTLDRPGPTLSGGEGQRARLATYLGTGLIGVCYILDEPTVGLHPRDTQRLLSALRHLQQRGSTVLVVEHDEAVIREADYLVDIGPGAGPAGGRIVANGPREQILDKVLSRGRQLRKKASIAPGNDKILIHGAKQHNLKNIDVEIPLGCLVCVTGVSGSGKSTLVHDILCRAMRRRLGLSAAAPGTHDYIEGLEHIDKIIEADQGPLGRSSRSTPATYTGLFDEIRRLFASTRDAKSRGYRSKRFSFNVRGGRCEACQGQGVQKVALQLLPDLTVTCPQCQGKRFDKATLEIRFKGKSIADVLDLSMQEALAFFANVPALVKPLQVLVDVGLGYLKLGQPSDSLSGGEAQRVKLATELARTTTGNTLILLDEPTTGLHFSDIERLLQVLKGLVDAGNSVIVIEHNLQVIGAADWVIDLGPDAGAAGGAIVAAGPPEVVAKCVESITGAHLQACLKDL